MSFKQPQPVISVGIGSSLFVKSTHGREAKTLNRRNVLVKICFEICQKSSQMKLAADFMVVQQ